MQHMYTSRQRSRWGRGSSASRILVFSYLVRTLCVVQHLVFSYLVRPEWTSESTEQAGPANSLSWVSATLACILPHKLKQLKLWLLLWLNFLSHWTSFKRVSECRSASYGQRAGYRTTQAPAGRLIMLELQDHCRRIMLELLELHDPSDPSINVMQYELQDKKHRIVTPTILKYMKLGYS